MATIEERLTAVLQELSDLKSGIPSHAHINSAGKTWRCSSPYCERGGDVRDEPQRGPGELPEDAEKYVRKYA